MNRPTICDLHGCRKHVKHVIATRVIFAHQVNMRGADIPLYKERLSFNCNAMLRHFIVLGKPSSCKLLSRNILAFDAPQHRYSFLWAPDHMNRGFLSLAPL